MTTIELAKIRRLVYEELEKTLQEKYPMEEERRAAYSNSMEAIESFWLKTFHSLCDLQIKNKSK